MGDKDYLFELSKEAVKILDLGVKDLFMHGQLVETYVDGGRLDRKTRLKYWGTFWDLLPRVKEIVAARETRNAPSDEILTGS